MRTTHRLLLGDARSHCEDLIYAAAIIRIGPDGAGIDQISYIYSPSGIMVGLGETREQVLQVMDDMRCADVDFLTIGQYLQPTVKHAAVVEFVTPEQFADYAALARAKGFLLVSSTPLTRSSYHADADFAALQAARAAASGH